MEALYVLDSLYKPGHNAVDFPVISPIGTLILEKVADVSYPRPSLLTSTFSGRPIVSVWSHFPHTLRLTQLVISVTAIRHIRNCYSPHP